MPTLIGLDFGSTTSSSLVASVHLLRNTVTGRMEWGEIFEIYRSPLVFTPLHGNLLDESGIARLIDEWLRAGWVDAADVVGGGALLTGLTAQRPNADAIIRLVRERMSDVLVASADDPRLESWLAFLGSCVSLSRRHPTTTFINIDIGGGTSNIAWGCNGHVIETASLFVGARHIRVVPGTYRIAGISPYALSLLGELNIRRQVGEELRPQEVKAIVAFQVTLLEAIVTSQQDFLNSPLIQSFVQSPAKSLTLSSTSSQPVITLSGGVGELVYGMLRGDPSPATTVYGDLGIDLAAALVEHPRWRTDFLEFVPDAGGRATVHGLLRHSTQLSGSTLHLSDAELLPLRDLPILGTLDVNTAPEQLHRMVDLIQRSRRGGALCVELADTRIQTVRSMAERLRRVLDERKFSVDLPLVLLLRHNVGNIFGQYMTNWGRCTWRLLVIDEIDLRDARYVQLGAILEQTIPVSFFGLV